MSARLWCLFLGSIWLNTAHPAAPSWWGESFTQILDPAATQNNFGPVNLGQLKHVATQAKVHLDVALAAKGGAGPAVDAVVASFVSDPSTNFEPANLGQLKNIAKPIYNRLMAVGYNTKQNLIDHGEPAWTFNYPWNTLTPVPVSENYAPSLIGQLKWVFSFDLSRDANSDGTPDWTTTVLDADGDRVPDAWEIANQFNHLVFDAFYSQDTDGDGFKDGYELWAGTDPRLASSKPPSGTPTGTEEQPSLLPDLANVVAGYTVSIDVLSNDDLPDNSYAITSLSAPDSALGIASSDGNSVTFRANPGVSGDALFDYTLGNAAGMTATAQITVHIRASNSLPVTVADTVTVAIGSAVNVDVLANDNDPDEYAPGSPPQYDPLSVTLESSPGDDSVVVQDYGIIHYRPMQETPGVATIVYRATDPFGGTSTGVVTVNIVESDPPPPAELEAGQVRTDALVGAPAGTSGVYYVSHQSGYDNNTGESSTTSIPGGSGPLKTIAEAKERTRLHLNSTGTQAVIKLMPGKHPLRSDPAQPLEPGLRVTRADIPPGKTLTLTVAETVTPANPAIVTGALEFWQGHGGTWTEELNDVRKFTFTTDLAITDQPGGGGGAGTDEPDQCVACVTHEKPCQPGQVTDLHAAFS